MRKHPTASLVSAASIAFSAVAETSDAAVELTGQSRSLHAESDSGASLFGANPFLGALLSFQGADSDDASASDFGHFDTAVLSESPDVLIFPLTGTGAASQTSSLSTTTISASASTDVAADGYWLTPAQLAIVNQQLAPPTYSFGKESDSSSGESLFSVTFYVSAPTPYALTGSLGVGRAQLVGQGSFFQPITTATGLIELRHALGGSVAQVAIDQLEFCVVDPQAGEGSCTPGSRPLSAQGVLAPGSYVLEARTTSSAQAMCAILVTLICVEAMTDADFTLELTFGDPLLPASVPALGPGSLGLLSLALAATGLRARRRFAS